MNPFVLYLLLLKATITSFAGLASLSVIRHDLTGVVPIVIAGGSLAALLLTKIDPMWVVLAASLAGLLQIL